MEERHLGGTALGGTDAKSVCRRTTTDTGSERRRRLGIQACFACVREGFLEGKCRQGKQHRCFGVFWSCCWCSPKAYREQDGMDATRQGQKGDTWSTRKNRAPLRSQTHATQRIAGLLASLGCWRGLTSSPHHLITPPTSQHLPITSRTYASHPSGYAGSVLRQDGRRPEMDRHKESLDPP